MKIFENYVEVVAKTSAFVINVIQIVHNTLIRI